MTNNNLAVPPFLKIPQAERDAFWIGRKLTAVEFAHVHTTREEDETTKAFRLEVEAAQAEKKAAGLERLKELKDKKLNAAGKLKDKTAATKVPGQGGKPLLDKITQLPEKGKRREVAIACYKGPTEIAKIAKSVGCPEGSVRSHLSDLHTKHGFGYRIEDGKALLLTPKGWEP